MHPSDAAPDDERLDREEIAEAVKSYLIGLALAALLTVVSFFISGTTLVWAPSIPVALVVLAIAQMGVHLVFFLHITTGPDNVNNIMALAFGVLIVLLLLTGSLWIMANLQHNMAPMGQMPRTERERVAMVRGVTAKGVVGPVATAAFGARASGPIQALDCAAETHVKAGQLCAKIDPRPYQDRIEQNRADLAAAEARLEKGMADLARVEATLESREAQSKRRAASQRAMEDSRKVLERARTQAKRDEARVGELEAALEAAARDLAYTDIVSPIEGTVVSRNIEIGQTVTMDSQSPLFVIAADSAVIPIDALVSAKDIDKVELGKKAAFTVEAFPNRSFSGVVTQIQPSSGREFAAAYHVVVSAPNPDHLLKPGMEATIEVAIE
jgi:cytochrome o ubiquinol oxidase subunit IV